MTKRSKKHLANASLQAMDIHSKWAPANVPHLDSGVSHVHIHPARCADRSRTFRLARRLAESILTIAAAAFGGVSSTRHRGMFRELNISAPFVAWEIRAQVDSIQRFAYSRMHPSSVWHRNCVPNPVRQLPLAAHEFHHDSQKGQQIVEFHHSDRRQQTPNTTSA